MVGFASYELNASASADHLCFTSLVIGEADYSDVIIRRNVFWSSNAGSGVKKTECRVVVSIGLRYEL